MSVLPFVYASDPFYSMDFYQPRRHVVNPFRELQRMSQLVDSVMQETSHELESQIHYNENGDLAFHCQTAGFKPEELTVDVDGDKLIVNGKHVESREGESVERQFSRVIRLPKEVDHGKIKCELDDKGELSISIPQREKLEAPKQNVPIEMKKKEEQK